MTTFLYLIGLPFLDLNPQPSLPEDHKKNDAGPLSVPIDESVSPVPEVQQRASIEVESATTSERNLEAYWATLTDAEIKRDVLSLQDANKYNAAQDRLDFLVYRNPHPENRFLWAKNNELLEHYSVALLEYDSLLQLSDLDDGWVSVLRYRRGIVLDDMNRHLEAVQDFKRALRAKGLSSVDKQKVNLLLGAAQIKGGRSWCGVWTINRALKA